MESYDYYTVATRNRDQLLGINPAEKMGSVINPVRQWIFDDKSEAEHHAAVFNLFVFGHSDSHLENRIEVIR